MPEQPLMDKMKRYIGQLDDVMEGQRRTEIDRFNHEGLEELEVETDEADVQIRTHGEEVVDIELHSYKNGPELQAVESDQTLKVAAKKAKPLSFGHAPKVKLIVSIPSRLWNRISVYTDSGKIELNGADVSDLSAKSGSGDLKLEQVRADEASLRTPSGDMTVQKSECQTVSFASSSGSISLNDVIGNIFGKTHSGDIELLKGVSEEIDLKSKSGTLEVEDVAAKKLYLFTTSGNIDAYELVVQEGKIKTKAGDISGLDLSGNIRAVSASGEVELHFIEPGERIIVQSTSGDIALRQNEGEWDAEISASSPSGTVWVLDPVDERPMEDSHYWEGRLGEGKSLIEVSSDSGDIEIS